MITREGKFDRLLLKQMFAFGLPLLVAGLAGMVNEAIDKIMLKRMLFDELGEKKTMTIIGIYGACYKISIIITLFIQAFRYAADPFFFSQQREECRQNIRYGNELFCSGLCTHIFRRDVLFRHYQKLYT